MEWSQHSNTQNTTGAEEDARGEGRRREGTATANLTAVSAVGEGARGYTTATAKEGEGKKKAKLDPLVEFAIVHRPSTVLLSPSLQPFPPLPLHEQPSGPSLLTLAQKSRIAPGAGARACASLTPTPSLNCEGAQPETTKKEINIL